MNIDLSKVPSWLFSVAAVLFAFVLFYALIWLAVPVNLGWGVIGRVPQSNDHHSKRSGNRFY
jgi:hypothetical protein